VVIGAVAGYLLLGLSGGLVLSVQETIQPGSFLVHNADGQGTIVLSPAGVAKSSSWEMDFARINYFAFVSLTTTGYGDVVPVKPPARMASVVLGIAGPLYMAVILGVLISRLAGSEGGGSGG
jgi:hypothetical protein